MKRFTHNRIQALVSFYGIPKIGQALAVERLFGRLAAFPEPLKANGGEVPRTQLVRPHAGCRDVDRLESICHDHQAPPTDIFDAAMLTGNVIRDRESLFLSRLIALTGTSLVVDQSQEPLTTAGDTASVASTVTGGQLDDSRRMFVVTRKDRCREAANVLFGRHN